MFKVSFKEFESLVLEGVEAIPERFRSRIKNVAFLMRVRPSAMQRTRQRLRRGETLLGLYEGIPHTERGEGYGAFAVPDKITIFQEPVEAEARLLLEEQCGNSIRSYTIANREEVFRREVRKLVIDTVWHEVAHHFGLDEERVTRRERERRGLK
ncbi:MAG: hypothetical protein A2W52_03435 [Candidatus Taylorbacteria bacterium RIFCSPHIGHO2_02_49_25]|uniref:Metallopeptidase family protein n=1 Tax=Candidatus Taylorbacteria bacterium RIFCSPHIGHO2_02_49_25 TaxID=1802305 RepID=A0A1G2MIR4_9BACT|nr:MAG: hypothetical protein A2759_01245 [Candidatus Taylorbacteria bacterium RIFCSPHIGHO2_01_FULL_49_60]OHA22921.1 MAG: hypothetical protein A2W52_03435 [Candidatus Taylorbacteria bacterium RIFCSPHIGHO2_02_49_25]OHA35482.1 MAG: hypothetical protein A3B27_01130 [Candidatus Taylorbacteria bacterium RIFCSPLOWO2_01_FULL_50_130]OHA36496.1 MAG: hypothetical protein A2W65_01235 [Candidatus Taylorbacteria bacterium RIFCSPLOWO2_02_50_13]OHA42672.1 MAG: hypothetical protein A3H73_01125 [Candidatus Taylo